MVIPLILCVFTSSTFFGIVFFILFCVFHQWFVFLLPSQCLVLAIVGGVDDQSVGGNVIPVVIFHGILPSVCTKMHSKSDWTQSRCPINCQEIQCSLVSHQNPLQSN
eukprot:261028_1